MNIPARQAILLFFRKVLVASASIPGLFDPVFIDAEANGRHFKEMHVDGGTTLQVLAIPLKLAAAGRLAAEYRPLGQLYIIINNILEPAFEVTKPKTLSITARAFNTIINDEKEEFRVLSPNNRRFTVGFMRQCWARSRIAPVCSLDARRRSKRR
jgi:hypothetical protein